MVVKLHTTIVFIFVVILFDYCCHFDNCYGWWLSIFSLQFWVVPLVNLMQSSAVLCVAVLKLYSFSVAVCDSMWQYVTVYSSYNVFRLWWQFSQYIHVHSVLNSSNNCSIWQNNTADWFSCCCGNVRWKETAKSCHSHVQWQCYSTQLAIAVIST